jgi:molybdopterin converting factor subunit 1
MITVKLFAMLREKAGTSEVIITERLKTVGDLIGLIGDRYPGVKDLLACGRILVSVNQEFVKQDAPLQDGDEVGLMPPFSGGQERRGVVRIQEGPFSLDAETARIKNTSAGFFGMVTFIGMKWLI